MLVISALGRLRQEVCCEFKANLKYIMRFDFEDPKKQKQYS